MQWTDFFKKVAKNSDNVKIQKQFSIILLLLFSGILSYGYWKQEFSLKAFVVGLAAILLLAIILHKIPKLLRPLLYIWLLFGMVLGEITAIILLGIIYYLLFFPITFILRKTRKGDAPDIPIWRSREGDTIDYKKLS